MGQHVALSPGKIYAYKRPDGKYGYMHLFEESMSKGGIKKAWCVQLFGDPTSRIITDIKEVEKLLMHKRTMFYIFEERIRELELIPIGHIPPKENELVLATIQHD